MSTTELLAVVLGAYFGVNFLCAWILHRHAERQAHLPVRFLDVVVHFVLLTAFGIPVLIVVALAAMFGRGGEAGLQKNPKVSHAGARAA